MAPSPPPPRRAALLLLLLSSLLLLSAVAHAARESAAAAKSRGHAELRSQHGEVRRASSIYVCSMPRSCVFDRSRAAVYAWR